MITWLDVPFKGTNKAAGFETLIHGFYLDALNAEPMAVCVDEDGVLYFTVIRSIALDWRYTRGKGWHSIDDPESGA